MSTRSTVVFVNTAFGNRQKVCAVYQHHDGYLSGVGKELAEFCDGILMVNGLSSLQPKSIANGCGCLAAQFIAKFKAGAGGLYRVPVGDPGEEYVYVVEADTELIRITAETGGETLFSGSPANMLAFIADSADSDD